MTYLKVGDWEVRANGRRGGLQIAAVDEIGRVSGRFLGTRLGGWWSERGHRLTFVVQGAAHDRSDVQAFTGYAWDEPPDGPGAERSYHLAGSYDTFGGGGGGRDRQTFGWFVTLVRAGPIRIGER